MFLEVSNENEGERNGGGRGGDDDLTVINETHTRLRKFLLSVSDLSGGGQSDAGRWSEFGTGIVPTLGLAFPSIISDSEASW